MVETAEKKPEQEHDPRKDGDIKVQMSVPVAQAGDALGFLGLGGQAEAPNQSEEAQPEPGIEEMLAEAHPEDVEAIKQRMADAGRPMPEGASIPEIANEMPARYGETNMSARATTPAPGGGPTAGGPAAGGGDPGGPAQPVPQPSQPAGQRGIPSFTGGGGGLPTPTEAFRYSMQDPPPIQTKQEFEASQKAPSWWRMMLADFAGGAPGAGKEELDKRMDKAYQEAIQKQMQDRSEFERKQGVVGEYAVKPGDEMVELVFGDRKINVMRKNIGQFAGLFSSEYDKYLEKGEEVSLRGFLKDPNAPDWQVTKEQALAYSEFWFKQRAEGLGTGRDQLKVLNPKLWKELEAHDLAQAKELADSKQAGQDKPNQWRLSASSARECNILTQFDLGCLLRL